MTNVGDDTLPRTSSERARNCVNVVLPAPSSPVRTSTSPARTTRPTASARSAIAALPSTSCVSGPGAARGVCSGIGAPSRVRSGGRPHCDAVDAGADAGDDLVVDGPGPGTPLLRAGTGIAVAEHDHGVPCLDRRIARVDDHLVHGDPTDDRQAAAADHHLGAAGGGPG